MATTKQPNPKAPTVQLSSDTSQGKAKLALMPSVNGAIVIKAFQNNVLGKDADLSTMIDGLRDTFSKVNGGDLHTIESMLVSQATALQTIFTSLAQRAVIQEHMKHYEAFLGLALKAQAQSRATLSALVDLKYPRQATFVKQANIAHGPQQVNNGKTAQYAQARTHAKEIEAPQNELLEDQGHGSTQMDTRATTAPARGDPAMATLATVKRATKRGG